MGTGVTLYPPKRLNVLRSGSHDADGQAHHVVQAGRRGDGSRCQRPIVARPKRSTHASRGHPCRASLFSGIRVRLVLASKIIHGRGRSHRRHHNGSVVVCAAALGCLLSPTGQAASETQKKRRHQHGNQRNHRSDLLPHLASPKPNHAATESSRGRMFTDHPAHRCPLHHCCIGVNLQTQHNRRARPPQLRNAPPG